MKLFIVRIITPIMIIVTENIVVIILTDKVSQYSRITVVIVNSLQKITVSWPHNNFF